MAEATKIEYLYVSYLRNSKQIFETDLNTFRTRFIRFIIRFLAITARIDVCGKRKVFEIDQPQQGVSHEFLGIKWLKQSQWWRRHGRSWLSDLVLTLYLLFNAHLLANLVYQYEYDFNKMRVVRLRGLIRRQLLSSGDFVRLSTIFFERADESRKVLRLIGAPHKHLSIAIECLYLYFIIFGIIMYYISFVYYRVVTPYDFHFVRELMDFDDEWRYSNALIEREVKRFLQSDRTFLEIELRKSKRLEVEHLSRLEKLLATRKMSGSSFGGSCKSGVGERGRWQELMRNDYRMYEALMHMLTSGALRPYNKSAQWVEKRIEITYFALGSMLIFIVLFATTTMGVAFYQRDRTKQLDAREVAFLGSTVGLVTIMGLSTTLTASTFFIGAIDQLVMVNKMQELILACWQENKAHFDSLVQFGLNKPESVDAEVGTVSKHFSWPKQKVEQRQLESNCVDIMNSNLLFVFLQYKIFISQYEPSRKTFQSVVVFAIALIMLIPLIIKLHIPYLNLSHYNNAKWFAILISPAILVPANFVLVPVCHLDAQFIKLFRAWSSLIAHIHETEIHPVGRRLYDRHSVTLLIREIRLTFQFDDQSKLSASASAVTSTYTTLVKAHFWYGAAVLAILADDLPTGHIGSEGSNSFLNDPFGIFARSNFLGV